MNGMRTCFKSMLVILLLITGSVIVIITPILAATQGFAKKKNTRKMNIVREYEIPVKKGKSAGMKIPAMMSFWGATNQQVIISSKFSYNVKPDKITVTADNLGMPRRNYVLRWNAPDVSKITVKQELLVEISCNNTLYTAAKLPYSEEILKRFAFSLGKEKNIDPEDKNLEPVCQNIIKKAKRAEEAVELVCDWVNDNIEFTSGTDYGSAETFTTRKGNCNTMSRLACAMVRKIGIPADIVKAKFIKTNNGHGYIEVYFPDAGWVFYDLSNWNRGFKSLDCLMATGWAFRQKTDSNWKWHDGYFLKEKDVGFYQERLVPKAKLRSGPKEMDVLGVKVVRKKPGKSVKVRHLPLREVIMNLLLPPGERKYVKTEITEDK